MKHCFTFSKVLSLSAMLFVSFYVHATDTFERVHSIIQTKCAASCHNAASPDGQLILSGDMASMYAALVGVQPTNPAAQTKGYKRVVTGRVDQSFLMKKINGGLEHNFDLTAPEGNVMPPYGATQLTATEKEMIRQWIIFGAPQTGEVTSEALIDEFYSSGITPVQPIAAPDPSEGFQIHHGPIFMEPGHELEAFRKIDLSLPDSLDIVGFDISMNPESHHFVIYQYNPTLTETIAPGIRISSGFLDEVTMYSNASFLDIWQFVEPHHVPDIAAFKWGPNTSIDFNFHIKNYSAVNVMAAEAYINIYTKPKDPSRRPMKFALAPYGGFNPFLLSIPPTAIDTTISFADNTETDEWIGVWKLQGHTHKLGKDYNVYLRNEDGTKGEHFYNGHYDPTHTFDQGYYDYSHPPVLKMEPLMCLNRKEGLIHEATYNNNTGETVGFGLTTAEEMFVTYYTYIDLDPSEVPCLTIATDLETVVPINTLHGLTVSPNPSNNLFNIVYNNPKQGNVNIKVCNILGETVAQLLNGTQAKGSISTQFNANSLAAGIYLLSVQTDKGVETQRIVKVD